MQKVNMKPRDVLRELHECRAEFSDVQEFHDSIMDSQEAGRLFQLLQLSETERTAFLQGAGWMIYRDGVTKVGRENA